MGISREVLDEDLILLIRKGNVRASEELMARYNSYSWKVALDFTMAHPRSGITNEEYHQVAFTSVVKAVKKYLDDYGRFYAYWQVVANNDLIRYFNENAYQAGGSAFYGLSLDGTNKDGYIISDSVGDQDYGIHNIIAIEELEMMIDEVKYLFKEKNDRLIINLFLRGHSFEEIVSIRESNYRHVTYVVSTFQKRMSELMQKRNYN